MLHIIHYDHPNCTPLQNIVRLPETEAFSLAHQMAAKNLETTAFYRFADFENYYPLRVRADQIMHQAFIALGGQPATEHPLFFVLQGSEYLKRWFDDGQAITLPLKTIPDQYISFTYGDSSAMLQRQGDIRLMNKDLLMSAIQDYNGKVDVFLKDITDQYHYIEVQVWHDAYCQPEQSLP